VPHAIVGRCRAEWRTAPRRGLLRTARDKNVQERLIEELSALTRDPDAAAAHAEGWLLIADIAEPPELADHALAAHALVRAHELDANTPADVLYRAAELYQQQLTDMDKAVATYQRFLNQAPDHKRAAAARECIEAIAAERAKAAAEPTEMEPE
jgi:hypothetical protein